MRIPRLRRIFIVLAGALIISILATFVLQYIERTQYESITYYTTTTVSEEPVFGSPYEGFVKKGYFDSVASVYAYIFSPYADYWETFNIWLSLDNSSWVQVPFLTSQTNDYAQMALLGLINLGNPQLEVYLKSYVPPQTVSTPFNITKEEASNFSMVIVVQRQATPQDTTQWILTFFTVFGFVGFILSLLFQRDDSRDVERGIKKKTRKRITRKKKETIASDEKKKDNQPIRISGATCLR